VAALCILAHHAGLPDGQLKDLLKPAVKEGVGYPPDWKVKPTIEACQDLAAIEAAITETAASGVVLPTEFRTSFNRSLKPLARMLDVRMLLSALVDADFIETEAWFDGDVAGNRRYRPEGPPLEPARALDILLKHVGELEGNARAAGTADERILAIRRGLIDACLSAADKPTGLFDLTAPTGAGKTLAMLAFALKHAAAHDLRRVVIVIPFLSIIEQTAQVYREIFEPHFGPLYVLEQHSLAGTRERSRALADKEDHCHSDSARRARNQLAENWDAPIVVTTSVQAIESLFAHRPAPCRKLHRLARSVMLFDEVQTLPATWVVPILGTLAHLASPRIGATVVFSTATQPAFKNLAKDVKEFAGATWNPVEIVPEAPKMFAQATRVRIDVYRIRHSAKTSWESLAAEIKEAHSRQVLCIVNLKRHALRLYELLQGEAEGLIHLSTSMCPAHRKAVLDEVREALRQDRPCRLISTQCVEAGVDVDFPRVLRALAPLEAILQAAGRCNRHGTRPGQGLVQVFEPERTEDENDKKDIYPPGYKYAAEEAAAAIRSLDADTLDPADLEFVTRYYRQLYDSGRAKMPTPFEEAVTAEHFATVARQMHLIEQDAINVLVPYDHDEFNRLRSEAQERGSITRAWVLQARPHTVGVFVSGSDRERLQAFLLPFEIHGEESDWWYLSDCGKECYHPQLGLKPPAEFPFLGV
jgi:CRISPR-associated helicase Cas3